MGRRLRSPRLPGVDVPGVDASMSPRPQPRRAMRWADVYVCMLADGVALRNRCPQGQADPRAAIAGGASGVTMARGLALDAMGRTIAGGPSGVTMVDAGPDALLLKPDDGPTCDEDDHLQGRHGRGGRRRAVLPDRDCPRVTRRR